MRTNEHRVDSYPQLGALDEPELIGWPLEDEVEEWDLDVDMLLTVRPSAGEVPISGIAPLFP